METETNIPKEPYEKTNCIREKLEVTREEMEIEALAFIEATKQFASEWIQREFEASACFSENYSFPENSGFYQRKPEELKSELRELPIKVSDIVEAHLNRNDYWIHRNALFQPDISRDYLEFKKEKIRKELISSVRVILGHATEIFWELEGEEPGSKAWVTERGRRKYACFLRFSDEMKASLNRYFIRLEELFVLNHEMKQEILRIEGKKL